MKFFVTWRFCIQKSRHFAKSKITCVTFLYTQILTLCVTWFSWNFWNWRRGGEFLYAKNNALCVTFLYTKNNAFCVTFYIKKKQTLCVTFLYARNNAIFVTLLYLKFIVQYRYLTKNVHTIIAIRLIDKFEPLIENWSYYYDK